MATRATGDVERRGLQILGGTLAALSLIAIYLLVANGLRELLCAGMCATPPTGEEVWRARGVSALLACTVLGQLVVCHRRDRSISVVHGLIAMLAVVVVLVFARPLT